MNAAPFDEAPPEDGEAPPEGELGDPDAAAPGAPHKRDLIAGLEKGLAVIEAFDQDRPRLTISEVAAHLPLAGEIERRFGLTRRQAEIARLLAGRLPDAEIATRLGISWHTVRSHTDRIFRAMRVHTRQEIVERITSQD